jgi:hypothetical protein
MRDLALVAALFAATAEAQVYSLSDFGRQCGGDLTGQVVQTPQGVTMRLGVSSAIPNAVAVLVLGSRAPAPIALPNSACLLLVDPRATMLTQTNGLGMASFAVPVPSVLPLHLLFQVVVADFSAAGRTVTSTDGVMLRGR